MRDSMGQHSAAVELSLRVQALERQRENTEQPELK